MITLRLAGPLATLNNNNYVENVRSHLLLTILILRPLLLKTGECENLEIKRGELHKHAELLKNLLVLL